MVIDNMLTITVYVLAIALTISVWMNLVSRRNRKREERLYSWYNSDTGWLNRTSFRDSPQVGQIFYADHYWWQIEAVDNDRKEIQVYLLDNTDVDI